MIQDLVHLDAEAFKGLLARNNVSKLYAFGSSVNGPFGQNSDVDILVEVDAPDELEGRMLINIWNGLEDLFKRPVDLLTPNSLRNPYLRKEIDRTKKLIYDGSKRQILV